MTMKASFHSFILLVCAALPLTAAPQFDPALSPFKEKAADSYSNFTADDGKLSVLLWGRAPLNDFGSREVKLDQTGVRQLPQIPAPGVHPRILFGPDDLPAVRARIKNTRCGQESWKNILSWTHSMKGTYDDSADYAKPDLYKGGYQGFHGRIPVFRLNAVRGKGDYNHNADVATFYDSLVKGTATNFPDFYWNTLSLEAFRSLINPHFPALRSDPSAVSGASRQKQIPSSNHIEFAQPITVMEEAGIETAGVEKYRLAPRPFDAVRSDQIVRRVHHHRRAVAVDVDVD